MCREGGGGGGGGGGGEGLRDSVCPGGRQGEGCAVRGRDLGDSVWGLGVCALELAYKVRGVVWRKGLVDSVCPGVAKAMDKVRGVS